VVAVDETAGRFGIAQGGAHLRQERRRRGAVAAEAAGNVGRAVEGAPAAETNRPGHGHKTDHAGRAEQHADPPTAAADGRKEHVQAERPDAPPGSAGGAW